MDAVFNLIGRYLQQLFSELGQITRHIDGNGWVCISVVLLVMGWFWLKGNKVKGA